MRRLLHISLLLTALLAISFEANSKPVTAHQALQRVTGNSTNRPKSMKAVTTSPQLVHTFTASATETEPMVYVFSRGADQGYLITPADDLFPAVLGYSDKGDFDFDNMPPAMKAFLEDYAREIDFNLKYKAEELATTASLFDPGWDPVEPLIKTQWNQNSPFNLKCPKYKVVDSEGKPTGEEHDTYTGCVATSLAQVLNYHKWPDVGTNSVSYEWAPTGGEKQTLSMDFSTMHFDWDNMRDNYQSFSEAEADAVSTLMLACGYSVGMNYGPSASGAVSKYQGDALVNFFKYSRAVRYQYRDLCSSTEFEKIIYDNLKEGLPVLYNGRSSSGGHSFICDGYSGKHYFHINWGWGGASDGYFYLARLNPSDQGIGSSEGGYNSGQGISYNIRPVRDGNDTGEEASFDLICNGHFNYKGYVTGDYGDLYYFNAIDPTTGEENGLYNIGSGTFSGNFGIVVRDSDNKDYFVSWQIELPPGYGYFNSFNVYLNGFPEGTYTIHPAYRETSAESPTLMKVANGCRKFVRMTVDANGNKSFSDMTAEDIEAAQPDMMVNCINYTGNILTNHTNDFLISVTNLSSDKDYYGQMTFVIKDEQGNEVYTQALGNYDIPASITIPSSVSMTINLPAGNYTAGLKADGNRELPGEFPLEVSGTGSQLTTDLRTLYFAPLDIVPNSTETVRFRVGNYGSSDVANPIFGIFYKPHGSSDDYRCSGLRQFSTTLQSRYITTFYDSFNNMEEGEYDVKVSWYESYPGTPIDISPVYLLRVGYPVETVAINEQGKELEKDAELQLTTTLTPENATFRTLSWSSSDKNVVSVDNTGKLRAIAPGTAFVSATAHNGSINHTQIVVKGNSSIEDIAADELRTVNAVYTISGVKILANPTEAQIHDLDPGLYIFQTPKRAFTVKK